MTAPVAATWDGLDAAAIARRCGAPRVEVLDATDSVLDVAHALAERGAPAGAVVVADEQRAGRGRLGRAWTSAPGLGVWCAVVERPHDAGSLDHLSIRTGLEIAERLDPLARGQVRLKWPNDLVLAGGKLGGILVEARWQDGVPAWVAVGVGVNVVAPAGQAGAAGLPAGASRADILEAIVRGVRAAASRPGPLSPDEVERYRGRDALRGRRIAHPVAGTVEGLAPSGDLLVRGATGVERVRAGTIRYAEDS